MLLKNTKTGFLRSNVENGVTSASKGRGWAPTCVAFGCLLKPVDLFMQLLKCNLQCATMCNVLYNLHYLLV